MNLMNVVLEDNEWDINIHVTKVITKIFLFYTMKR